MKIEKAAMSAKAGSDFATVRKEPSRRRATSKLEHSNHAREPNDSEDPEKISASTIVGTVQRGVENEINVEW